jgi:hypothetical protein
MSSRPRKARGVEGAAQKPRRVSIGSGSSKQPEGVQLSHGMEATAAVAYAACGILPMPAPRSVGAIPVSKRTGGTRR